LIDKKEIENIFSKELQWVKDKDFQKKGISAWKTAANQEKWKTLDIHDDIVFNNYVYSYEEKKCKCSPEAYIVHHCNLNNFQIQKNMGK